jgi:hypothetical protein
MKEESMRYFAICTALAGALWLAAWSLGCDAADPPRPAADKVAGWYCTSRDGSCYLDREECAAVDRDGSGQDEATCGWLRRAWVTTYYGGASRAAWETQALCLRWRRALDARDRLARTTRCEQQTPEAAVAP